MAPETASGNHLVVDAKGVIRSKSQAVIPSTTLHRWMFEECSVADPHKPVLIDASRPTDLFLSWDSYRSLSLRFAAGLMASGLQRGQRVLAVSRNSIFCPVAFMGTVMAGGIYCTADPAYDEYDLARTLQHLEPSLVLVGPELAATVSRALELANRLSVHVHLFHEKITSSGDNERNQAPSWWGLLASEQEYLPDVFAPRPDETDETVAIVYSSGTTGVPKGVQISHRNYIAAAVAHMTRLRQGCSAIAGWRVLGSLSMHHVLGQRAYSVVFPLLSVATYVAIVHDYTEALELMDRLDISLAILRSSTVTQIGKNPGATSRHGLKHLKRVEACASGLEMCIRAAAEKALSRSSPVQVASVWGLTELGLISGWDLNEVCNSSSVGELHANYEARVVQSDGQVALTAGVVGEIQIRAPSATRGYWRNAEASRELVTDDGWVKTGDLGDVDHNGKWYISDRIKVVELLECRRRPLLTPQRISSSVMARILPPRKSSASSSSTPASLILPWSASRCKWRPGFGASAPSDSPQ